MGAPRVLFVEGDGAVPRGAARSVVPEPRAAIDEFGAAQPSPLDDVGAVFPGAAGVVDVVRADFGAPAGPDLPPRPGTNHWVMWRLLSGNNRELGRSASVFPGLDEAIEAVGRTRATLHHLQSRVVQEAGPSLWSWIVLLDEGPVARSARTYQRLRECHYSLSGFMDALPSAVVLTDPSRVVRQRRVHPAAVEPVVAPLMELR